MLAWRCRIPEVEQVMPHMLQAVAVLLYKGVGADEITIPGVNQGYTEPAC